MTLLTFFYILGIVFGIIFIIVYGAALIGIDSDTDVDIDVDSDGDVDATTSTVFGEALSLKGAVTFITFFAWLGVSCVSYGCSTPMIFLISGGGSFLLTLMFALIMYLFKKLQAKPRDVDDTDIVGNPATVYLFIPGGDKRGKIQISIRGALRTIDALSQNGERIDTNSQVTVTEFITNNLVKVSK